MHVPLRRRVFENAFIGQIGRIFVVACVLKQRHAQRVEEFAEGRFVLRYPQLVAELLQREIQQLLFDLRRSLGREHKELGARLFVDTA